MKSIDIRAHLTPRTFVQAARSGQKWHGLKPDPKRITPRNTWTPEQRIADMDSLGVDMQVVSIQAQFYCYERDPQVVSAMHRECNEEVHQMTIDFPDRFKGFAHIPIRLPHPQRGSPTVPYRRRRG